MGAAHIRVAPTFIIEPVLKRISYGLRRFDRFRVRILLLSKKNRGCNKMYFFTFALQSLLHAETTKALEIVLSQDTLVVFPFLGALK